jgi:hypothetical protein
MMRDLAEDGSNLAEPGQIRLSLKGRPEAVKPLNAAGTDGV